MIKSALERVRDDGYAFDTETWLTSPGVNAPPLVCGSVYHDGRGDFIYSKPRILEVFLDVLQNHTMILANAPYDMLVMRRYAEDVRGMDITPLIFKAYLEQRVFDVLLAEQLHALAKGNLGKHTETGAKTYYSLEDVLHMVTGREDAKSNDVWRKHYQVLDGLPEGMWPIQAKTYPIDDVRNTYDVAQVQLRRNHNLHDLHNQQYTDFCLALGAAHGLWVDLDYVNELERKTISDRAGRQQILIAQGYLRQETVKGEVVVKKNTAYVKRKVVEAFGVSGACLECNGRGKVPSTTKEGQIKFKKTPCKCGSDCEKCIQGRVPTGYKGCPTCSGTGLDLNSAPHPLTKTGGVSADRDALNESGDDELLEFAAYDMTAKVLSTYIPWLRESIGDDGERVSLTLRPKVLKSTGRVGYGGAVHQLPRDLHVREAIVARPGYLLVSCDWTGAELITHAQNCYDYIGYSKMGDAILSGVKVHDLLGSKVCGCSYEHMVENRKTNKDLSNYRQSAKPINFGAPGLMGPVTLVGQQRKSGPDTKAPNGKVYKGLRFCILAGGETECGHTKTTEHNRKQISPTCVRCIEVAGDIIKVWKELFPENIAYFDRAKRVHATKTMVQPYTGRVRSGMTLCATANSPFQGLAGDAMKLAWQWLTYEAYCVPESPICGSRPILPVHDEAIVEVPEVGASDAAKRVSEIMVAALSHICPKMAPAVEAEPALMRRWDKDAEPVYNEQGDLIPWEPKT